MIWLLFTLMAFAVVTALVWPLLRSAATTPADRAAYDLTVFRDQLAEVDRDVARGVLTSGEAEAARLEIQRRMLGTSKLAVEPMQSESPQARTLLTAGVAVAVPFLALALYMMVGAPMLPAHRGTQTAGGAAAGATAGGEHGDADVAAIVEKLAARMKAEPDSAEGWSLLARSYRQMERYADAAEAYRNLMRLEPDEADGYAGFAEVTTASAGGQVTPEAKAALVKALQLDRDDPRARFYFGLERAQAGDARTAIAIWRDLTASAPQDAPWLGMVRGQMGQVAQEAGIMPMSVEPKHPLDVAGGAPAPAPKAAPAPQQAAADPASPDVTALKGRFSPENLEMIQGMVGGLQAKLADNPEDYNGWMLLGRSYTVLQNTDGAKQAYGKAAALKPTEMAPREQLVGLMLQGADRNKPSAELVRLAEDMRKLDPKQPQALFVVGLAKAGSGDTATARKLWAEAAQSLPPTSPLRAEIEQRSAALK